MTGEKLLQLWRLLWELELSSFFTDAGEAGAEILGEINKKETIKLESLKSAGAVGQHLAGNSRAQECQCHCSGAGGVRNAFPGSAFQTILNSWRNCPTRGGTEAQEPQSSPRRVQGYHSLVRSALVLGILHLGKPGGTRC